MIADTVLAFVYAAGAEAYRKSNTQSIHVAKWLRRIATNLLKGTSS